MRRSSEQENMETAGHQPLPSRIIEGGLKGRFTRGEFVRMAVLSGLGVALGAMPSSEAQIEPIGQTEVTDPDELKTVQAERFASIEIAQKERLPILSEEELELFRDDHLSADTLAEQYDRVIQDKIVSLNQQAAEMSSLHYAQKLQIWANSGHLESLRQQVVREPEKYLELTQLMHMQRYVQTLTQKRDEVMVVAEEQQDWTAVHKIAEVLHLSGSAYIPPNSEDIARAQEFDQWLEQALRNQEVIQSADGVITVVALKDVPDKVLNDVMNHVSVRRTTNGDYAAVGQKAVDRNGSFNWNTLVWWQDTQPNGSKVERFYQVVRERDIDFDPSIEFGKYQGRDHILVKRCQMNSKFTGSQIVCDFVDKATGGLSKRQVINPVPDGHVNDYLRSGSYVDTNGRSVPRATWLYSGPGFQEKQMVYDEQAGEFKILDYNINAEGQGIQFNNPMGRDPLTGADAHVHMDYAADYGTVVLVDPISGAPRGNKIRVNELPDAIKLEKNKDRLVPAIRSRVTTIADAEINPWAPDQIAGVAGVFNPNTLHVATQIEIRNRGGGRLTAGGQPLYLDGCYMPSAHFMKDKNEKNLLIVRAYQPHGQEVFFAMIPGKNNTSQPEWDEAKIYGPFDVQDAASLGWGGRDYVGEEYQGAVTPDREQLFGLSPDYSGVFKTSGQIVDWDVKKIVATHKVYMPAVFR